MKNNSTMNQVSFNFHHNYTHKYKVKVMYTQILQHKQFYDIYTHVEHLKDIDILARSETNMS